jgi:hypothetical protein
MEAKEASIWCPLAASAININSNQMQASGRTNKQMFQPLRIAFLEPDCALVQ